MPQTSKGDHPGNSVLLVKELVEASVLLFGKIFALCSLQCTAEAIKVDFLLWRNSPAAAVVLELLNQCLAFKKCQLMFEFKINYLNLLFVRT